MKNIKSMLFILGLCLGSHTIVQALEAPLGTTIEMGKDYHKIEVHGKHMYLLHGTKLSIFNTTNISQPVLEGHFENEDNFILRDMHIVGNYAYILSQNLLILDISDLRNIRLLSSTPLLSGSKIDVLGDYAYVLQNGVMKIVDISDPTTPKLYYSHSTGLSSEQLDQKIIIKGNYAYIHSDYSNSVIKTVRMDGYGPIRNWGEYVHNRKIKDIALDTDKSNTHDYIYILDVQGLKILEQAPYGQGKDITRVGQNLYNVNIVNGVRVYQGGKPKKLDILGNRAYVTDKVHGLLVFDISDATHPTLLYRDNRWLGINYIDVTFTHAYVINPSYGLQIIDVSVLSNAHLVHTQLRLKNVKSVAVKGNYLYAVDEYGLKVIDITYPLSPKVVNAFYVSGEVNHISLKENFAYLPVYEAYNYRLLKVDISDPLNIEEVSSHDTPVPICNTQIVGNYAYVFGTYKIFTYHSNLNPSATYLSEYIPSTYSMCSSFMIDYYAYLVRRNELEIVDMSNPYNPVYDHSLNLGPIDAIHKTDYFVYLTGRNKLEILNTSNPRYPVHVSSGYSSDSTLGVSTQDQYLYTGSFLGGDVIEDGFRGLTAVNVSDPRNPVVVAGYKTNCEVKNVEVLGNYAYTSNEDCGISVIKIKMTDTDNDGIPDLTDADDDNDGISDVHEIALGFDPLDENSTPLDTDADGSPNALDTDDDNDGISDVDELALGFDPLDSKVTPLDTDSDGSPDALDMDDDNDGISDVDELALGFYPLDDSDGLADSDKDGFSNALEFNIGTDMYDETDKPIWTPIMMNNFMIFVPAKGT